MPWPASRSCSGGWKRPGTAGAWRALALGALALACQVFAGHLQDTILTAGALVGSTPSTAPRPNAAAARAARRARPGRRPGGPRASLVSAVQWVPSKELLDRSPRAGGLDLGRPDLRVVAPRAAADPGRPRGLRHPRPRHRLDGRLLPLSRDERLPGPDRAWPWRSSGGGGLPRPLGRLLGPAGGRRRRPDARPVHVPVRLRASRPDRRAARGSRCGSTSGSRWRSPRWRPSGSTAWRGPGVVRSAAGDRRRGRCWSSRLDPDPGLHLYPGLDRARPLDHALSSATGTAGWAAS